MAEITTEEILTNKKNYKNQIKQLGREGSISEEEILNFFDSVKNIPEDDRAEVEKAIAKDFSNYNNLDKYYRNCIAIKAVNDMEKVFEIKDMNFENPNFVEYLKNNLMNCALHKGFSVLKDEKPYLSEIGKNFSRMLLEKTLQIPTKEKEDKVISELGENQGKEILKKNLEKQKIMAKTLFMAQIGNYSLKQKNNDNPIDYEGLLSETIVHGGRTNIILPYGYGQEKVMDSIYGKDPETSAELKSRWAATHYVTQQKMNDDGSVKGRSVEESPMGINLFKVIPKQFGMNIAVGGIGEEGPDKKTILPNGTAGHMYIRKALGDEKTCGSLLVGFESADSNATSFTGHKHDFLAKSAQQSAFLGDKNLVGKKTDGRTIDLSGLSPEKFEKIMNEFDRVYSNLQNEKDSKQLEKLNSLLTGKRLDEKNLIQNLTQLSFNKDILEDTILPARLGFQARINISEKQIPALAQSELSGWKEQIEKITSELKIDLNNSCDLKRLFAVEKVNGKFTAKSLFDEKHDNARDYYKRIKGVTLNGGRIFAFKNGESEAKEVTFENGEFKLNKAKNELTQPVKPSLGKRVLNTITFGIAFKNEISIYNSELKNFEQEKQLSEVVLKQEENRKIDAENEIENNNRILLDSEKLKKDLGMEASSQKQKTQPIKETEKSLKNDKTIVE